MINGNPAVLFNNAHRFDVKGAGSILNNVSGCTYFCVCNTIGSDDVNDSVFTVSIADPVTTRFCVGRGNSGKVRTGWRRLDGNSYQGLEGHTYVINE